MGVNYYLLFKRIFNFSRELFILMKLPFFSWHLTLLPLEIEVSKEKRTVLNIYTHFIDLQNVLFVHFLFFGKNYCHYVLFKGSIRFSSPSFLIH